MPFPAENHVTWTNEPRTVWFAGWEAAARGVDHEPGWHVDVGDLVAFTGRVWPRCGGWHGAEPVATQLARHLRAHPLPHAADDLAGVYIVASMAARGVCSVVTDPVGAALLYWARHPDVVVLSSRAAVAAALFAEVSHTTVRRDALGVGWLAYAGFPMGSRTGFEDVAVVPDGAVVEIDAAGTVDVRRPSRPAWRLDTDELAADPAASLHQVRGEITTAIRTALHSPGTNASLGLTGGKDSRLVLALLLAEGSAKDLEYETIGDENLPDVVFARQLASTFGLHHIRNPGIAERWAWHQRVDEAIRSGGLADCTSREIAFRITAWATSGMRNAGEPQLTRLPDGNRVLLSGVVR